MAVECAATRYQLPLRLIRSPSGGLVGSALIGPLDGEFHGHDGGVAVYLDPSVCLREGLRRCLVRDDPQELPFVAQGPAFAGVHEAVRQHRGERLAVAVQ